MPVWNSPLEIIKDEIYLATTVYVCCGVALWEYCTQFPYEWDVLRRVRRYRWTIWVYSCCRLCMTISLLFLCIGVANGWLIRSCTASYAIAQAFSYTSTSLASLLIVLRVVAIWDKHRLIMAITYSVWLVGVALNLRDVSLLRASYNPTYKTCAPYDTKQFLPNSIGILGSDSVLLVMMLVGILRHREAPKFSVAHLLYRQGVVWLLVASLVEIPVLVFCILDLNAPLSLLLQPVQVVALGICAGRMYRGLMSYSFEPGSGGILLGDLTRVRPVASPAPSVQSPVS
ncbi:unnamed protein product [Peniophora sp. CBMAI 1063]|nr:unnamed protein product [Peniophora sp. CBMAI 1063]